MTEPPELCQQRQRVYRLKVVLRDALCVISQQLVTLHKDLEHGKKNTRIFCPSLHIRSLFLIHLSLFLVATQLEDLLEIAKTLKDLKDSLEKRRIYFSSQTMREKSKNRGSMIPQVICTSNVESGHFGLQGRRPTMEDFVRE